MRLSLSMLLCLAYSQSLWQHVELGEQAFGQFARNPRIAGQSLIFVNAPCTYYPLLFPRQQQFKDAPVPRRIRTLAPGIYPLQLERRDLRTLVIRSPGGLLQPLGEYRGLSGVSPPALSPVYLTQRLNQFARAEWRYRPGDTVQLSDLHARVLEVTHDGFPRTVAFEFNEPLESENLTFLVWRSGKHLPFAPPAVGQRLNLPPVLY